MQVVKRFEPEKGFRLASYAMWWIKAAVQEYIRSWSLVKMGDDGQSEKAILQSAQGEDPDSALDDGDLRPDQVATIARRLGSVSRTSST